MSEHTKAPSPVGAPLHHVALWCDHCGCEAIDGAEFHDGQGEKCESCGWPGHVVVEEDGEVWWYPGAGRGDTFCDDSTCGECTERRIA